MRSINRARVISLIRRNPGLMRAELSQLSGLSKATVSALVEELLREDFLCEDSAQGSRRRKKGLHLNGGVGVAVGFDIWPGEIRAMVTDASMQVLGRVVVPLSSHTVSSVLDAIDEAHRALLDGISAPCLGVMAVVPSPVDAAGLTVVRSVPLGWVGVPLGSALAERFHCQAGLVNSARAAALGEYWHGAAKGIDEVVGVSVSDGLGAGILIGGQLLGGATGASGELGHMTILPDGPLCGCGNRGCLERLASLPAIIEQVQAESGRWGSEMTYHDIIRAALDGDRIVISVIERVAEHLGIGIANAVNLFSPRMVVISGQLAEAGEMVVALIRQTVQRRAQPVCLKGVEIVGGELGMDADCVGACALVIDRYVAQTELTAKLRLS